MFKTGIVKDQLYLEHKTEILHPENPGRLEPLYAMLEHRDFDGSFVYLKPRFATLDELLLVHEPRYIDRVLDTAEKPRVRFDPDTVTSPKTYKAAWLAAGGVMVAVEGVIKGDVRNAFALVRPPGHHALRDRAMGYCIFNNVAIGACYAMKAHGLMRILIVDWDLHHGNGIQSIFYEDPRILYFSLHRYPYFPWTGAMEEVGKGKGEGYNINVPLDPGCSDAEYCNILRRLLFPIALQFRPELIMVAAGFDIHHADPMHSMNVTTSGFARMTNILMELSEVVCNGRMVLALEGGYNPIAMCDSVAMVLRELSGQSVIRSEELEQVEDARYPNISQKIDRIVEIQGRYWKGLEAVHR